MKQKHPTINRKCNFIMGERVKWRGDDSAALEVVGIHNDAIQFQDGQYISGIIHQDHFEEAD